MIGKRVMLFGTIVSLIVGLWWCQDLARAQADHPVRVNIDKPETSIPDLLEVEWVELRGNSTLVSFQFLREYCDAGLDAPGGPGAFRIVNTLDQSRDFKLLSGSGALAPGVEGVCGNASDRFVLKFEPLPPNVAVINILEGAGGQGEWAWYGLQVRKGP